MKARHLLPLATAGIALSSCVSYSPQVPEIPYYTYRGTPYQGIHTSIPDTWVTEQPGSYSSASAPAAAPAARQENLPAIPDPKARAKAQAQEAAAKQITPKPLDLSKPLISGEAKPTITAGTTGTLTVPTTTAAAAAAAKPADLASITNQGPIPVATRVEGDPTRVYNPLDPSKTIRVIDKNGNPHPSGKLLKVRGTNFQFYVP